MALERSRILEAALTLLDQSGLDGLTMRRLAETLGVKAASIYWHYPGKSALLTDMAAATLAPIAVNVPSELDYRGVLRIVATQFRQALLRRRDGAMLLSGRLHTTLDGLRLVHLVIAALQVDGFDTPISEAASFTLFNYVQGFVLDEQALGRGSTTDMASLLRPLTVSAATQYPAATAALADFLDDRDARFLAGLDLILAGLHQRAMADHPEDRLVAAFKSMS